MILKKKAILLLLSLLATSSFGRSFEKVVAFGAATQGNGYNWPATMAWISASLDDSIKNAQELGSDKTGISILSFAGGSSGSAITLLFNSLLTNEKLFTTSERSQETNRILSIEDVKRLSLAMKICALGADMDFTEALATYYAGAKQQVFSRLDRLSDISSWTIIPDFLGGGRVNLWEEQVQGNLVINDFSYLITFAQNLNWGDVSSFRGVDFNFVIDREKMVEEIRSTIRKVVKSKFSTNGQFKKRRKLKNHPSENNPYSKSLSKNMGDGFMTITFAEEFDNKGSMNRIISERGLDYQKMGAYLFMNKKTAQTIISNPSFRNDLNRSSHLKRFNFLEVDYMWSAINPSIREPELVGELAGKLQEARFSIKKLFSANRYEKGLEQVGEKSLYIIGGFAYEEISSIPASYYFESKVNELREKGIEVLPIFYTFGHPGYSKESGKRTFAQRAIAKYLSKKGPSDPRQDYEENFNDYNQWVNSFESLRASSFKEAGVKLKRVNYNWDQYLADLGAELAEEAEGFFDGMRKKIKGKVKTAALVGFSSNLAIETYNQAADQIANE